MKKSRFTEEQIIGFLKQAEAGMPMPAEREPEHEAGINPTRRVLALADRVALEAALCDLRACRTLLAELRPNHADLA